MKISHSIKSSQRTRRQRIRAGQEATPANYRLVVTLSSGINSDGFEVDVVDDSNTSVFHEKYSYGYNASYSRELAEMAANDHDAAKQYRWDSVPSLKPFTGDIINDLCNKYGINKADIEYRRGKNTFTGGDVGDAAVQQFINDYVNASRNVRAGEEVDPEFAEYEDDIERIDQEFTSENTSINSTKLPALFNMVHFQPGTVNADVGGGRWDNVADYLSQYDVINLVYDPYNRSEEHNKQVISTLRKAGGADTGTCSNVLNVIKEPEARLAVLRNLARMVKPGGEIYITVYEGRGDGKEGPTKSGYQLHRKTNDYLEEVQQVFPDAHRKGKLIVATNGGVRGSVEARQNIMADDDQLEAIRVEIENACKARMQEPDFGVPPEELDDYLVVDHVNFDGLPGIQVRAEFGWEGMELLREACDPIIQKYDKMAYFEQVTGGIMEAYLSDDSLTASVDIKAGGPPISDSEMQTDSMGNKYGLNEPQDEVLDLDMNGVRVTVDENGEWDYNDLSFVQDYADSRNVIRNDDGVRIDDVDSVIEALDDLLMASMPGTEGVYELSGHVVLHYTIDNVWTKLGRAEGEDETILDDADVTFNKDASEVDVQYNLVGGEDTITSSISVSDSGDIGDTGYVWQTYSNGQTQIKKHRPYDDANYY